MLASAPTWREFAADENWREAIIAYLRTDWRRSYKMWSLINEIVGESCQRSRFDLRAATFECLREMMSLRRERVIIRYRRKWVAILDNGVPVIPFEIRPSRPALHGRSAGDSTRSTFQPSKGASLCVI